MNQSNIRQHNGNTFSVTEAAAWLKELDDRTKSSKTGFNSIDELAGKVENGYVIGKKNYHPVSISNNPELLAPDGNSLKNSHTYRVRLTTLGTGTYSGTVILLITDGVNWTKHLVSKNGSGSNYPNLIIVGGIVKINTDHASNYTVQAIVEEVSVNQKLGFTFWGSDSVSTRFSDKIGIGTEAPSEKLEVVGNVKCTTLIQTSDKKYKQNIEPIDGEWALSVFKKLKFSFYDFTITNNKQAGLIAQEVEKIIPQAVHTSDTGEKALNHTYIDMICKAGIQHFIKTQI